MFAFWSAAQSGHGSGAMHDYRVLPWHQSTTRFPDHWPADVGNYWVEARRSLEGKNWTAAALMARSAVQLVARKNQAKGKNLKEEIDDLAAKGLIIPISKSGHTRCENWPMKARIPSLARQGRTKKTPRTLLSFSPFS